MWMFSRLVLGAQWVNILAIKEQFSYLVFRPNLQFYTHLQYDWQQVTLLYSSFILFYTFILIFILFYTHRQYDWQQVTLLHLHNSLFLSSSLLPFTQQKAVLLVCLLLVVIMWSLALCHQLVLNMMLIMTTAGVLGVVSVFEYQEVPARKLNSKLLSYCGPILSLTIPL